MIKEKTQPAQATVFIIDDDEPVREAVKDLLHSVGLQAKTLSSTKEFSLLNIPDAPSCLVLDVRLPGISGLDFQTELTRNGHELPIVFMTGHGDVPMSVKAMKAGAVEFLIKPFRDQDLLDAVRIALERNREQRDKKQALSKVNEAFVSLTKREEEVFSFVTAGLMNKQIAAEMAISEITVKVHRSNVVRKMGARSLAELVRMADALGIRRRSKTLSP
jgi:FixJ family two-component response regulator